MPLVRLEVRNEFGLGQPELYKETNREDPKAVLDGVAVAGLVGILRQLGDLADFAAEVFHGLQEQVMTTASRSHRLMIRVQNIEASLPPLEKAVLAQTSHIHFAYTAGCEWHPRIKTARNHFIYNDLPHFIMDSYEECRDPPRMHLLDKFDTGGPGSCFRRYSDPTFFKRASADSDEPYSEKTEKARKSRKYKKKRSSRRNGEFSRGQQMHSDSSRTQFISSSINGRTSTSTIDMTMKFDLEDRSNSFDSKSGAGYIECVLHPNSCMQPDEKDCEEPSSSRLAQETVKLHSISPPIEDNISHDSLEKQIASCSSGVTWDEKEEIVESTSQVCDDTDKTAERVVEKHDSDMHANDAVSVTNIDYSDILFNGERNLKPVFSEVQTDDIDSEPDNFMDALNSIESESEIDLDYETKRELRQSTSLDTHEMVENEVIEAPSSLFDNNLSDVVSQTGYTVPSNKETCKNIPDSLQENHPLMSEPHASNLGLGSSSEIPDSQEMIGDTVSSNKDTIRDLPYSLEEIHPHTSEPHASNLESVSPLHVPYYREEITKDTVSSNKKTSANFPDSLPEIPPLTSEPPVSNLGYVSPSDPHTSEPHASNLESVSPLHVPYYREEITKDAVSSNKKTSANFPDSLPEIPPLTSEPPVSNLGYVSPSDVPVSKEVPENFDDSHSSESPVCERDPHTRENTVLDHSVCTHNSIDSNTANDTVSEPVETDISFSGSKRSKLPDEEASKINNNKESLGDHSVRFWTNGGLLGLEPSKPPDFNLSCSLNQGSLSTKNEIDDGSRGNLMHKGQELSGEVVEQILNESSSRLLTTDHNDDQACISEKTSGGSQLSNGQTEMNNLRDTGIAALRSVLPAAIDKKDSPEHNQGNGENSPNVFGLANRLLIKSLHRKVSFDEKSGHYNSLKSVILEQSEQNGIVGKSLLEATFKEKVSSVYPIASLPPSPPLEHMKISFHPVNGLDTSKLKLKFPDGNNHHESIRDMFPSFQLVPESSIPLDDSGFHSDGDDTFCRSSPYVSDDCQTPRSDYDSDQWESDETPETSDHGADDSPHRRSSTESMSSTKEHGRVSIGDTDINSGHCTSTTNGVEPSFSGPLLDFPSFDNVSHVVEKESNRHSEHNSVVMSHSHPEPTRPPPPPPVPPMQWWVLKPQLEKTNETQNSMSEDSEHINDQSLLESSIFQQPRLAEVEQIQINHNGHSSYDNIIHQLKEKLGSHKLNGQKEANQLRMGKEMDEREDFLYQIRTKSFNLRPTVTGKPNATMGPTANVQVTAILEKANAIRQVVASDDGEDDDNWSDT